MADLLMILTIINSLVLVLILWIYLPTYFKEKGKNLATKEDIGHITNEVEKVRTLYLKEIEKLKSALESETMLIQKRRQIYEEISSSLRVFVTGHPSGPDKKDKFLNAYATAWLWAPDSVIHSLNKFLDLQVAYTKNPGNVPQEIMKAAYAECVVEMRKDVGFLGTNIRKEEYRFVQF